MNYLSILAVFAQSNGGFVWLALIAGLILAWFVYMVVSLTYNTVSVREALLRFILVDAMLMTLITYVILGFLLFNLIEVNATAYMKLLFVANIIATTMIVTAFAYISLVEAAYKLRNLNS